MLNNTQIPSQRVPIVDEKEGPGPSRPWFRFFGNLYTFVFNPPHVQLISTTNQTAAAVTATAITYSASVYADGFTFTAADSKVYATQSGTCQLGISIQLGNTDTANREDVAVWLRVNGADIANSATYTTVPVKHAGINGTSIISVTLLQELIAGDYFELYWHNTNGTASIVTYPVGVTPVHPQAPGVIVTALQVL